MRNFIIFSVLSIRFLRKLPCFKDLDKKSYIVWCDTGSHFRCSELLHYLFFELASQNIIVSLNFFCEKHGKNSRDQHFSLVSNFIKQESMVKKLCSSQDICDAIEKGQFRANLNNARITSLQKTTTHKKFEQAFTRAFVVPVYDNSTVIHRFLAVDNLKRYYNFFTDGDSFLLKSHFMSDQSDFEVIKTIERSTIDRIKTNKKKFCQTYEISKEFDLNYIIILYNNYKLSICCHRSAPLNKKQYICIFCVMFLKNTTKF